MNTQAGLMTVEEFLKLPDPQGGYYELRHGEAVFVTYPKWGHERRQGRITNLIKRLSCREGEVRMEMAFRPTQEHQLWRADVAFVRAERADAVGDDEFLISAPELVVEVLSPSNTAVEIDDRRLVCLENGCSSFWVV